MTTAPARDTYTVDEVAALLGIGRNSAYAAVQRGEIPALRIGARLLVPRVAFDAWLTDAPDVHAAQRRVLADGAARAIIVSRFEDAPEHLRALSAHGGDEDWLAVIPRRLIPRGSMAEALADWPNDDEDAAYELPGWMWSGTSFGPCHVSVHRHPTSAEHVVAIGAHA